jgi:hypothetical protein
VLVGNFVGKNAFDRDNRCRISSRQYQRRRVPQSKRCFDGDGTKMRSNGEGTMLAFTISRERGWTATLGLASSAKPLPQAEAGVSVSVTWFYAGAPVVQAEWSEGHSIRLWPLPTERRRQSGSKSCSVS